MIYIENPTFQLVSNCKFLHFNCFLLSKSVDTSLYAFNLLIFVDIFQLLSPLLIFPFFLGFITLKK